MVDISVRKSALPPPRSRCQKTSDFVPPLVSFAWAKHALKAAISWRASRRGGALPGGGGRLHERLCSEIELSSRFFHKKRQAVERAPASCSTAQSFHFGKTMKQKKTQKKSEKKTAPSDFHWKLLRRPAGSLCATWAWNRVPWAALALATSAEKRPSVLLLPLLRAARGGEASTRTAYLSLASHGLHHRFSRAKMANSCLSFSLIGPAPR